MSWISLYSRLGLNGLLARYTKLEIPYLRVEVSNLQHSRYGLTAKKHSLFCLGLGCNLDLSVDLALGQVVQAPKPAHARGSFLERKALGVDHFLDIDLAIIGLEKPGRWVQLFDNGVDSFSRLLVHAVDLVEDNGVCELTLSSVSRVNVTQQRHHPHLVDHQVSHRTLVLGVHVLLAPSFRDEVCGGEVVEEIECVNHGDQGVEFDNLVQASQLRAAIMSVSLVPLSCYWASLHLSQNLFILLLFSKISIFGGFDHGRSKLLGEGLGDLHGLTNACALNEDVITVSILGQPCQLLKKIASQSTADAAVLHLDQTFLSLGDYVSLDQGDIDV